MKIGVYPGTFDPITIGHIDIIARALKIVDKLYIAIISNNCSKSIVFSQQERIDMIEHELHANNIDKNSVELEVFSGLLVNFAKEKSATISIRGMRVMSDFEYEFQMANINLKLDSNMETIFLPAKTELQLVSSTASKEIIKLGGDSSGFVSDYVRKKLQAKYS